MLRIVKSNGQRENFDEDKLRRGLRAPKCPVSTGQIDAVSNELNGRCNRNPIRKLNRRIGDHVMHELKALDQVRHALRIRLSKLWGRICHR